MWYVIARMRKETQEMTYRIYITDALNMIAQNTAKFAGGVYPKKRYAEQVYAQEEKEPKQEQSGQEIADSLIKGLTGLGG